LLEGLNLAIRFGQHVVLVGANGSGKTTLIRTISGQIPLMAGNIRLGSNVKAGFMSQDQDLLDPEKNALDVIASLMNGSETETRYFLSKLLFKGDDVFLPVKNMSYGERSRLALACLIAQGCNFLVLDEPINHLDLSARSRFEQALSTFQGTILSVVHDRYFITKLATEVWKIQNHGIRRFERTNVYGTEGIFELD
jgi:ATP-binding cassette subfamily F protein 3